METHDGGEQGEGASKLDARFLIVGIHEDIGPRLYLRHAGIRTGDVVRSRSSAAHYVNGKARSLDQVFGFYQQLHGFSAFASPLVSACDTHDVAFVSHQAHEREPR